ncbi:MAG: DUF167 domain-containing protein [Synechococcaceae cyanobacterium]
MSDRAVAIQVLPRASRDAVVGERQGAIAIRLRAPAVEGAANQALRRFLAERLGVAPRAVRLLRGDRSRRKWIAVEGWSAAALQAALLSPPAAAESPDPPTRD